MTTKRFAIVRDNYVINCVLWDGNPIKWRPPQGAIFVESDLAAIGDWWEESEKRFYRPIPNNDEHESTS